MGFVFSTATGASQRANCSHTGTVCNEDRGTASCPVGVAVVGGAAGHQASSGHLSPAGTEPACAWREPRAAPGKTPWEMGSPTPSLPLTDTRPSAHLHRPSAHLHRPSTHRHRPSAPRVPTGAALHGGGGRARRRLDYGSLDGRWKRWVFILRTLPSH